MKRTSCSDLADYFEGCLFFTAGRLFRTIDRLAFEAFKDIGMAPSHAFLIMALAEAPKAGITPSALSRIMNLDPSTVTRLVTFLETKGWIARSREGRISHLTLLGAGRRQLPGIQDCWKRMYHLYCREFGEAEANALNRQIARFLQSSS